MTFVPAEIRPIYDGEFRIYTFANGYGASVLRHMYSQGGGEGLFELAVLGRDGRPTYDTPITHDLVCHATEDEVQQLLREIAGLPARDTWPPGTPAD